MVAFFVPEAADADEAEHVYQATRKHVGAPETRSRIRALTWRHNGQSMHCEVGGPAPDYYGTGDQPVVAIFDNGNHFFVCTLTRGVVAGGPIYAEKDHQTHVWHFD